MNRSRASPQHSRWAPISEFELTVRAYNCLRYANILFVGDLVQMAESELSIDRGIGRKSLKEIREVVLEPLGLRFGMRFNDALHEQYGAARAALTEKGEKRSVTGGEGEDMSKPEKGDERLIAALKSFLGSERITDRPPLTPERRKQLRSALDAITRRIQGALSSLSSREEKVLRMRFGISDGSERLDDLGQDFEVTRERIRQIEAKALRKLRHPSRSASLRAILKDGEVQAILGEDK